jgi:hypothetical protein
MSRISNIGEFVIQRDFLVSETKTSLFDLQAMLKPLKGGYFVNNFIKEWKDGKD